MADKLNISIFGIFHLSIDTFFLNFVLKNSSGVQKIVI